MNKAKNNDFLHFVMREFWLQRHDFWQVPAIVLAVFIIIQAAMMLVYAIGRNPTILGISVAGLMAFVTAGMMNLVAAASRFCSEFRMAVHMSISRRRMIGTCAILSLVNAAENALLAWVLQAIWSAVFGGPVMDDFMSMIPLWGWLAMCYVPVAAGMLSGAVMLRFNKIGFWVLYGIFMLGCFGPQLLNSDSANAPMEQMILALVQVMPMLFPAFAAVCAVAGVGMLWNVPVGE